MKFSGNDNGYTLLLSAVDTYEWAHRPGSVWVCSRCSGSRLKVQVDRNGICEMKINGRSGDVPGEELEAIVAAHLPAEFRHLWPVWEKS